MLDIKKIIVIGLFLRIAAIIWTVDLSNLETWEYGAIAENLANGKGYSLFHHKNTKLEYKFDYMSKPYNSAYMPPGYVVLIYPVYKDMDNIPIRNGIMLGLNVLFDCLTMIYIYKFTKVVFNDKAGLYSSILFAVFPQFIILSTKVGTGSVFMCLASILFYITLKRKQFKYSSCFIGLLLGVMAYMRSEALLFGLFIVIWIVLQKKYQDAIIISLIMILSILPWQLRSYSAFGQPVSLTTSSGLNLYRGNNPYYPGFWSDERIDSLKTKLEKNNKYEISLDNLYKSEAISYLKEYPINAALNVPVKVLNLWGFDWHDSRALNPLYILSHFALLGLFIYGYFKARKNNQISILLIYLIFFTVNCGVFFALPRYQVMMEIAFVPFAGLSIFRIFENRNKKGLTRILH